MVSARPHSLSESGDILSAIGSVLAATGTAMASQPLAQTKALGNIIQTIGQALEGMGEAANNSGEQIPHSLYNDADVTKWSKFAANAIAAAAIAEALPFPVVLPVLGELGAPIAAGLIGIGLAPEIAAAAAAALLAGAFYYGASNAGGWLADALGGSFFRRDPLVFDLNLDGVQLSSLTDSTTYFDLDGDGFAERTGWVSPLDGLLVRDLNGNGLIDNGGELFGTAQTDGFTILRALDSDGDNRITSSDNNYGTLRIWQDSNSDGVTQAGELKTLSSVGIESVDLAAQVSNATAAGNSVLLAGNYTTTGGAQQEVIAVAFSTDQINTVYQLPSGFQYDPEVFGLPNLHGYGQVTDLWVAMTLDPTLKQAVKSLVAGDFTSVDSKVGTLYTTWLDGLGGSSGALAYHYNASPFEDMLARWAGVAINSDNDDGIQIEDVAEAFMNRPSLGQINSSNINFVTNPLYFNAYRAMSAQFATRFYAQVPSLEIGRESAALANLLATAVPTNGTEFTLAEMEALVQPIIDRLSALPSLDADLEPITRLSYDFYNDAVVGDVRGAIDDLMASLNFDPAQPWADWANWASANRLLLNVIDPDGEITAESHRAKTGNLALDILTNSYSNLLGDAGGNILAGGSGRELLAGKAGNDSLQGGDGDDTYVLSDDFGSDVIIDTSGRDEIAFQGTLTSSRASYAFADAQQKDLRITFDGRSETVLVKEYFSASGAATIEKITFSDGPWMSERVIRDKVMAALATAGDDTLTAFDLGSAVFGASGNDTLLGKGKDDRLTGGIGNDALAGNGGNDTYVFARGDGQDTISEYSAGTGGGWGGNDTIQFAAGIAPADVVVTQADDGKDLVLTISGTTDSVTIDETTANRDFRVEQVRFADGTVWTHANLVARSMLANTGNDVFNGSYDGEALTGGAGNDTLRGRDGDDTLVGGVGDDTLSGDGGNDVYKFDRGDGQDVISEYSWGGGWGGNDTLQLGTGIAASDITVTQADNGRDLVISIIGTTDTITLNETIVNDDFRVEQLRFDDGTVWSHADLLGRSYGATSANDAISGDNGANVLSGLAGDDILRGRGGNDTLIGGVGNDTLSGDGGDDTYQFERGDGQDRITEYSGGGGWGGSDTVLLGSGIAPSEIVVTQGDDGRDLIVSINGTTDSLTIDETMVNEDFRLEQLRFADGTIWTHADLVSRSMLANTGDDLFSGSYDTDTLSGGAGNDALRGRNGDDTLAGGTGNDRLSGDGGDDTYLFARGDGRDVISEYSGAGGWGGNDTLQLAEGIAPSDVVVTRTDNGRDLVISITNTADRVTLDETVVNGDFRLEQVRFADGTVWTHDILLAQAALDPTNYGSDGADTLTGTNGDDVFDAGLGNDLVLSGQGNDIFRYRSGDGTDEIYEDGAASEIDVLRLTDLNASNISLRREGWHLYVRDLATGEDIKVDYQFYSDAAYGIERVEFAGGVSWDRTQIQQEAWIRGGAGADPLYGSPLAETLVGNGGNDFLEGRGGGDTYVYAAGDGSDEIFEEGNASESDVLRLVGLDPINVALRRDGWHLYVRDLATGAEIKVDYQFYSDATYGVELIAFNDGTVWDRAAISARLTSSTDAADQVVGTTGTDYLRGLGGDDVIIGDAGNDQLLGDTGNDRLEGGMGNDSLDGGVGADIAIFAGLQASYSIVTNAGTATIVDSDATTDGDDGTDTLVAIETAEFKGGVQVGIAAPVILDLDGNGVNSVDRARSGTSFDWDGDGIANRTAWVGHGDAFLVYDRNGDGTVSGANELSFVNDKASAKSDLDGLSAFDSNGDGKLAASDAKWLAFGVWADSNGDGRVDAGEFRSLADAGVTSITLAGQPVDRTWGWGEAVVVNTGSFTRSDGSLGTFNDVALSYAKAGRTSSSRQGAQPGHKRDRQWGKHELAVVDGESTPSHLRGGGDAERAAARLGQAMSVFGATPSSDFLGRRETGYLVELPGAVAHEPHTRFNHGAVIQ